MRKVLALIVLLLCLTSLSANISPYGLISKVNFSGIIINQVGKGGIYVGRLDLDVD